MLSVIMLSVIMLSVIMLSVDMLGVIMLSFVMLSVAFFIGMLSVTMLSVIMLSVITLNVEALCGLHLPRKTFLYLTLKMVAKGDEMFGELNSSLGSVGRRNKNKTGFPWFLTFPKFRTNQLQSAKRERLKIKENLFIARLYVLSDSWCRRCKTFFLIPHRH